mgnify:FL=1
MFLGKKGRLRMCCPTYLMKHRLLKSVVAGSSLFTLLVWIGMANLDQTIGQKPDLAFAHSIQGIIRAEIFDDRVGAIDNYDRAIVLTPECANYYYLRAKIQFILGDKQGAIDDFDRAIQLQPNYINAYLSRGVVRASLGNRQGAIDDNSQAIRLGLNPDR